jgi:hypothetical protein
MGAREGYEPETHKGLMVMDEEGWLRGPDLN